MAILNIWKDKEEITNYITNVGFLHKEVKSEKKYYTNGRLQIRIGNDGVAFLDKYGNIIERHKQLVLERVQELSKLN